ncbi:TPA: hypothetical protein EYP37_11950 [Candidatus Poribacteria bacterium]|nr:hypothetical protein [Candidatus Poribacteria bacterium]
MVLQIIHGFDGLMREGDVREIEAGLRKLKGMGIGGVVCNVSFRDYLRSEKQWEILSYGIEAAERIGLVIWLYDEEGYPSGAGGGLVLEGHPEFEAYGLICSMRRVKGPVMINVHLPKEGRKLHAVWAYRMQGDRISLDSPIRLDLGGRMGELEVGAGKWCVAAIAEKTMFEGTHCTANVYKRRRYINILDRRAVARFIELTHQEYKRRFPDKLGSSIEAIFTDEPSLMTAYIHPDPEPKYAAVPWCEEFPQFFRRMKGYDIEPRIVALFTDKIDPPDEARRVRCDYYDAIAKLCAESYFGQIQDWCRENGIVSTGHPLWEEEIVHHVAFEGSLFEIMRRFDIPGIDMLSSRPERVFKGNGFLGAKFASSAAHIQGLERVMSETSDYIERTSGDEVSIEEMKGIAALQFVMGVNVITSYYPWQKISPDGYKEFNDFVRRLGEAMTGGRHVADVAILYPVVSVWADFLPTTRSICLETQSRSIRRISGSLAEIAKGLLESQIDFDFLDDRAIQEAQIVNGKLLVAQEEYTAVVIPPMEIISFETARKLIDLARQGGLLIAFERVPDKAMERGHDETLGILMAGEMEGGLKICRNVEKMIRTLRERIKPDLFLPHPNRHILYNHRVKGGSDIYLIFNLSEHDFDDEIRLRASGPIKILNPDDGSYEEPDETDGKFRLKIRPLGAKIVVVGIHKVREV